MRDQRHSRFRAAPNEAFMLLDLFAVLAILCLVAALLFPMLLRGKMIVQAGACLNNLHQIQNGWILYNNENNGNFPYNAIGFGSGENINWVAGEMNYNTANTDNTNFALLVDPRHSLLAPYVRNPAVYRCPADQSRSGGLTGLPRVRSYSMNAAIGPNASGTSAGQGKWLGSSSDSGTVNQPGDYTVYLNNNMVIGPLGPSSLNVLVDEHPDGINDGSWAFYMPPSPPQTYWIDIPTPLHGNAGNLSFADGHAEIHQWLAPNAIPPVTYTTPIGISQNNVPHNPDIIWLASHTSVIYPP